MPIEIDTGAIARGDSSLKAKAGDLVWKTHTDELDRIASMILAIAYSGSASQAKAKQELINIQCVAVAEAREAIFVASNGLILLKSGVAEVTLPKTNKALSGPNSHWNERKVAMPPENFQITKSSNTQLVFKFAAQTEVRSLLASEGIRKNVEFPPECQNEHGFHSEMALISFLSKNNIRLDRKFIGVSKPCCRRCAAELDRRGIGYSFIHSAETISGFQEPFTPNPL